MGYYNGGPKGDDELREHDEQETAKQTLATLKHQLNLPTVTFLAS